MATSYYLKDEKYYRFQDDAISFSNAGAAFTGIASEYARAGLHFSEGRIKCRDCSFDQDLGSKMLCCPRKQHSMTSPGCKYLAETRVPNHSESIFKDVLYGGEKSQKETADIQVQPADTKMHELWQLLLQRNCKTGYHNKN